MKNVKTWWLKPTSFVPPDLVPSESVPSLGSCCRGTRPNGIKSTSLPGRKSGKLTNRKSACLKNAAYKKPTNSNIKVHDWVRMIEIPQIPQPFGLSTWSRHSLANFLFDLGEPGSEVVSEWKLWHVVSEFQYEPLISQHIEIHDPLKSTRSLWVDLYGVPQSTQPTFKAIFPCAWPPATQFQFSFCRGFFDRHSKGLATDMYAGPGDMKLEEKGGRKISEWQNVKKWWMANSYWCLRHFTTKTA